jgi:hypothetical protein
MTRSGRLWRRSIVFLVAVALAAMAIRPAVAQQYSVIQPKINAKEANVLSGKVATILRDAQPPNDAAKTDLNAFFNDYHFRVMTSTDPVQLGALGATREQLFTRYINTAKSQQARDYLNGITLKAMGVLAKGNYHPAVRYNAALIIGQLDEQAGGKPIPAATEALLGMMENDQFNKVPVPTAVKVAALVGLQRHTKLGVDAALGDRITKAALAVADREQPPEDTNAKVYGWVRRQAARVLANQFAKGLTPPVHDSFVRMIGDDKTDVDDRCGVAQLLQPPMIQGAQGLDLDSMALALGELAKKVLDVERKDAEEYIDKVVGDPSLAAGGGAGFGGGFGGGRGGEAMYGGRGGEYGGRGMGMAMAMIDDTTPHYEKRRMIDRTLAIASAADAVAAGGSDELKQRLTQFATAIRTVAETAASTEQEMTISQDVVALAQDVDKMVAAWAPAAEAPAAEQGDEIELPGEVPAPAGPAAEAPATAAGGN